MKPVGLVDARHVAENAWGATGLGSEMPPGTSGWFWAPPQLLPMKVPDHIGSLKVQQQTAKKWRFLPPCSPTSVKSLAGSSSPKGSGVAPFSFWRLAARPFNEFSFCCYCCFSIIIFKSRWPIKATLMLQSTFPSHSTGTMYPLFKVCLQRKKNVLNLVL